MPCVCTADGAAAVEALRAELAQAKEQPRAAALKAAEDLRAEQASHRRSEEKIAEMAGELKNCRRPVHTPQKGEQG